MTAPKSVRGSALIVVILVILILTTVGIGVAYFSTTENQISGNVRLQKASFYAAEAGLRAGEQALASAVTLNPDPSPLLPTAAELAANTQPPLMLHPPGGGWLPRLLVVNGMTYTDQTASAGLDDPHARLYYTLYVRNNADDIGGASQDKDKLINLISVGQYVIVDSGGTVVMRGVQTILEEQCDVSAVGVPSVTQKGDNTGGTGGAMKQ